VQDCGAAFAITEGPAFTGIRKRFSPERANKWFYYLPDLPLSACITRYLSRLLHVSAL
jgi:hypothetical protein